VLKLATDENVDGRVIRGLLARMPDLDVVRVQDAGHSGADDRSILAWAAAEGRVLLTHDVRTMTRFAGERIKRGDPLTGVVISPRSGRDRALHAQVVAPGRGVSRIECSRSRAG